MNKTPIEWVRNPDGSKPGYSWNPITGCLNKCPYCYADKLAGRRLKERYLANSNIAPVIQDVGLFSSHTKLISKDRLNDPFYPRLWEKKLDSYSLTNSWTSPAKGIFVCDMSDLFGIGVPWEWTQRVLDKIAQGCYSQHIFYLLTKQPKNLVKFNPFPPNCYIGVSATDSAMFTHAAVGLDYIDAKAKYVSFEPLLSWDMSLQDFAWTMETYPIDWIILGACTGDIKDLKPLSEKYPDCSLYPYGNKWTIQPKLEWVRDIVKSGIIAGIPIFLKDNLLPLFEAEWKRGGFLSQLSWGITALTHPLTLRQEMPRRNS